MIQQLSDHMHAVLVLPPNADVFDTSQVTKAVALKVYEDAHFLLLTGVGATGTATVTAEACSDAAGTGATAIPFKKSYQAAGADAADTWVASVDVTAAGYATPAGSKQLHAIDVDGRSLPDGLPFVRLKFTEVVNSPVIGGVVAILTEPTYVQRPMITALA